MEVKAAIFAKILKQSGLKVINNKEYVVVMFKSTLNPILRLYVTDDMVVLKVISDNSISTRAKNTIVDFCNSNNINFICG